MPNTQGMGAKGKFSCSKPATDPNLAPPMEVKKRSIFSEQERAELKSIIIEALVEMQSPDLR